MASILFSLNAFNNWKESGKCFINRYKMYIVRIYWIHYSLRISWPVFIYNFLNSRSINAITSCNVSVYNQIPMLQWHYRLGNDASVWCSAIIPIYTFKHDELIVSQVLTFPTSSLFQEYMVLKWHSYVYNVYVQILECVVLYLSDNLLVKIQVVQNMI